ncbi:hypothetical protein PMAYCL1PPCAC_00398, partial [Pristionchus mayeri]
EVISATTFDRNSLNGSEMKWLDRIVMMIKSAESGELRVREHVQLAREDSEDEGDSDSEWDYEEEDEEENTTAPKKKEITKEMYDEAYAYYRSGKKRTNSIGEGVRTIYDMHKQFSWIKTQDHIDRFVRYNRTGDFPNDRNEELHKLAEELNEAVDGILAEGYEFHDKELRDMVIALNDEKHRWPKFRASKGWIDNWKKRYRIVSRHITVLVSQKT